MRIAISFMFFMSFYVLLCSHVAHKSTYSEYNNINIYTNIRNPVCCYHMVDLDLDDIHVTNSVHYNVVLSTMNAWQRHCTSN